MQRVQHARSLSDARRVDPVDPMIDPIVVRVLDPVFDRPDSAPLPACRDDAPATDACSSKETPKER